MPSSPAGLLIMESRRPSLLTKEPSSSLTYGPSLCTSWVPHIPELQLIIQPVTGWSSKQPHSGWETLPLSIQWHPFMHQGRLTLYHCRAGVQHYIVPSRRVCDWSNAHTDFSHPWPIHWQWGMFTHHSTHLSSPNITSQPSQTTHQQGFIFIYTCLHHPWCGLQATASHHIIIPFRFWFIPLNISWTTENTRPPQIINWKMHTLTAYHQQLYQPWLSLTKH